MLTNRFPCLDVELLNAIANNSRVIKFIHQILLLMQNSDAPYTSSEMPSSTGEYSL